MARNAQTDERPCGWCRKKIGRGARVCPHCFRGQGLWILVTALPTWLAGVVAVAGAAGAIYFHDASRRDLADARALLDQTETQLERARSVLAERRQPVTVGGALADAEAHAALDARIDGVDARLGEMASGFEALERSFADLTGRVEGAATMAQTASTVAGEAGAAAAALEDSVQKAADARLLGSVEARIDHIDGKYEDTEAVCERAPDAYCLSSRDDAVTSLAALGQDLEEYRGRVTAVAHQIMTRNACNRGRRMIAWPPNENGIRADAWSEFTMWYRTNCV